MRRDDALIVILPEDGDSDPHWLRIVAGEVALRGTGTGWLHSCGIVALPASVTIMLLPPASLTVLHWVAYPDLPVRQGRAAARLKALEESLALSDSLFAAADRNDDPASPHIVAVAARSDLAHWLLWAQHHGLNPDRIVPPALLLPLADKGWVRGGIGSQSLLRGPEAAMAFDPAIAAVLGGDAPVAEVGEDVVVAAAIAALDAPPLDLRQGDFEKRERRPVDPAFVKRAAVLAGLILLVTLLISLATIMRYQWAARGLDDASLEMAQAEVPAAQDAPEAEALLTAKLARRGDAVQAFSGRLALLYAALQAAPDVTLTRLAREPDGTIALSLVAPGADAANRALSAMQQAGFVLAPPISQMVGGRLQAEVRVLPS